MKKTLIALAVAAVVGLVVLGVWGYLKAKEAFLAPMNLIQVTAPAMDVVFTDPVTGDESKDEKARAALREALKACGARTEMGMAMWMGEHGFSTQSGEILRPGDAAKIDKRKFKYRFVAFPRQSGWALATPMAGGAVGFGLLTGRFMGAAMTKAQGLGWRSYCVFIRMEGNQTSAWLVPGPHPSSG